MLSRSIDAEGHSPWQRYPITTPPAAVRDEIIRLRGPGRGRGMREVVAASDQAGGGGAVVMRGEARIDVGGAFGRFDDYEACARAVGGAEVYVGLVV